MIRQSSTEALGNLLVQSLAISVLKIAPPLDDRAVRREERLAAARAALAERDFEGVITACRGILDDPGDRTEAYGMLAVALHRAGRTGEAVESLQAALEANPDSPDLHGNLGEIRRQSGDLEGAVEALRRAVSLDAGNPSIHFNLGRAYLDSGDFERAAACFRDALELDHSFLPGHRGLCRALASGAPGRETLEDCCLGLAELWHGERERSDFRFDLRNLVEQARRRMRFEKSDPRTLLVLGKLLVDLGEMAFAIEVLERLRGLANPPRDSVIALSMAFAARNEWHRAHAMTSQFVRDHPLGVRPSPRPEAEVLVLEALYNPAFETKSDPRRLSRYGTAAYARFGTVADIAPRRVSFHHLYIDQIDPKAPGLGDRCGVIYNNASFAEINLRRRYAERIKQIGESTGLGIINDPDAVDLTTRSKNYERLKDMDGMVFPKTLAFTVSAVNLDAMVDRLISEFDFPILVRTTIHNLGHSFLRADTAAELRRNIVELDVFKNEPMYAIQYHESRHPSGAHLRYRAIFIDGVMYAGRMYLGDNWLVARGTREAGAEFGPEQFEAEERRWMSHPAEVIGSANADALARVNDALGLDALGIDFGIGADGRLIVFEANPNMDFLTMLRHVERTPYLGVAAARIAAALEDLFITRSKATAAVA